MRLSATCYSYKPHISVFNNMEVIYATHFQACYYFKLTHNNQNHHQFNSVTQSCPTATPWTAARQASLYITNSRSLLKLMSFQLVMPSNHLMLCHPLLLLPTILPSTGVFPNESVLCIGWPKFWSFSFSISPSNEYSGLISFRIDRLDLFAVQGTLKSLLQRDQ